MSDIIRNHGGNLELLSSQESLIFPESDSSQGDREKLKAAENKIRELESQKLHLQRILANTDDEPAELAEKVVDLEDQLQKLKETYADLEDQMQELKKEYAEQLQLANARRNEAETNYSKTMRDFVRFKGIVDEERHGHSENSKLLVAKIRKLEEENKRFVDKQNASSSSVPSKEASFEMGIGSSQSKLQANSSQSSNIPQQMYITEHRLGFHRRTTKRQLSRDLLLKLTMIFALIALSFVIYLQVYNNWIR